MEAYLCAIKVIANSVIAINNTLPNEELAQFTLLGVGCDYESLVTTAAYLGGNFTFDDLSAKFCHMHNVSSISKGNLIIL